MRLGYHYTTRQRWEESVQHSGLFPHRIRQHELDRFRSAMPLMPDDAVWVWREILNPKAGLIACLVLGEIHDDFDMVMLEVQYGPEDAMSECFRPTEGDTVTLTCGFSAGRIEMGQRPIELIHRHIPPERLRVVWKGNLLEPFGGIHQTALVSTLT